MGRPAAVLNLQRGRPAAIGLSEHAGIKQEDPVLKTRCDIRLGYHSVADHDVLCVQALQHSVHPAEECVLRFLGQTAVPQRAVRGNHQPVPVTKQSLNRLVRVELLRRGTRLQPLQFLAGKPDRLSQLHVAPDQLAVDERAPDRVKRREFGHHPIIQFTKTAELERRAQAAMHKHAIANLDDGVVCAYPPSVLASGPKGVTILNKARRMLVHPCLARNIITWRDCRVAVTTVNRQKLQVVFVRLLTSLLETRGGKGAVDLWSDVSQVPHHVHDFMVPEQRNDLPAPLRCLTFEGHQQIETFARSRPAVKHVARLHERGRPAGPLAVSIDQPDTL